MSRVGFALPLILGGAAVHRCGNCIVFEYGFTGCGKTMASYQGIALAIP
jgi:hypothetical protein